MVFWIHLYAFIFPSRLSWILNTQMVSQCQSCCLVGVCWWWPENLDTSGHMGMYLNDLSDRIPLALWEFSVFPAWATRITPLICTLRCPGFNPHGHLCPFMVNSDLLFWWNSSLMEGCKHGIMNSLHLSPRFTNCEYLTMYFIALICYHYYYYC